MKQRAVAIAILLFAAPALWSQLPPPPARPTGQPRAVSPAADPVTSYVQKATVSGLIVALRITGSTVTLEGAWPARIPRPRKATSMGKETVTVAALGSGARVASTTVGDPLWVIEEHAGLERRDDRQVIVSVPTPRAVDTIEVTVSTSGATARFDVAGAYAEICRALPRDPVCAGRGAQPK